MRTTFFLFTALCLASCGEPLTQIVLVVNSDIPVADIGPILIRVQGPGGGLDVNTMVDFDLPGGPTRFPITLGLVLEDGAVSEMVSVEVIATEVDGSARVEASARTNFVIGSTRELGLLLNTACVEISCGDDETCGPGGTCESNQIAGENLPEFTE